MVTKANKINSAYAKAKAKSGQARIQKRINQKLDLSKKSKQPKKATARVVKPKSTAAIKKRANKMFDSF